MNAIVINDINVNFEVVSGRVFINSLELSKVFGKRHDTILRAIKNLPQDEFFSVNSQVQERTDLFGVVRRSQRFYNLTRDGFSLLVMGFTGAKAYKWKIEFIKAFNLMEAELNRLKSIKQTNRIANLEAIQISQAKHHQSVVNGYKAQLTKHNEQIKLLKAKLTIAENEAKNLSSDDELLEKLEWLFKRSLADGVIYAINSSRDKIINDALKRASNKFMSNLHLLKKH